MNLERPANCPPVSVIICTLNEAENLPHVLPKIPEWVDEILLVDGNSTDDTIEVAKTLKPNIKIFTQPGKGKGDALKFGIAQAEGDIIVIPEGVPHQLTNVGLEKAIITWSCAPSPE